MFWRRKQRDQDLDRELRSHLESEVEEQTAYGVSPEEARYAALRVLGNSTLVKEATREVWGWNQIERVGQDLRFALRACHKNMAFALVAVIVLALGTGANTAIFTLVHAVLLRPLPFKDPDRVMLIFETIPKRGVQRSDLCAANFFDLQQRSQSFSAMAVLSGSGFNLTANDSPEQVPGALVSASFFSVLGVSPHLGRNFRSEDEYPGAPNAVIISDGLWQRRFGKDEGILGKTLLLNGRPHQVVGIMPPAFQALFRDHQLWVPMQLTPDERGNRNSHFLLGVARLKQGLSPQRAASELAALGNMLQSAYPLANAGRGLSAAPVHDELVGDVKPALILLMGAVTLLLLVACVNVANLLLARSLSRRKEIAVRRALGASRKRLLQQLLTEGLLLASLGVGAGLLLAVCALRALPLMIPAGLSLPGLDHLIIDRPVLLVAGIIGVFVTSVFGCMPAWQLFKSAPGSLTGRGAAASQGSSQYRLRNTLLSLEVALSLVLLFGAGLLLRSFGNLMEVQPGFRADRVLTVQLQVPPEFQLPFPQVTYFRQIQERVRAIPGVEDAAAIEYLPLSGSGITRRMLVQGRPRPEPGAEPIVQRHLVSAGYFSTMGVPLRAGRAFRNADTNSQHLIVVINDTMARHWWPNQNPTGQYLQLGVQASVAAAPPREIVGVVGDVRHTGLSADPRDEVYVPLGQDAWPIINLVVRSESVEPASLISEVKSAVWSVDKTQPLPNIRPMTTIVAESVWEPHLNTVALTAFALVALTLALAGIYAHCPHRRGPHAEIGVRMPMGAPAGSVLVLVVSQGFTPVVLGAIAGIGLAVAGGRFVATQLYGVTQADPLTFAGSVALILISAFLAMAYPAWQASRVDPMIALRHE